MNQVPTSPLATRAPAKVNLTLHVLGRRPDGYHELDSLVAFAGVGDDLALAPGDALSVSVEGPTAGAAGPPERNLVMRAARALAHRRPGLATGAFRLVKRLPAAAGIGGGSSDAAAALRLLARLNGLAVDDPDVVEAARSTGADIPVCLDPRARMMRGVGEDVGPPLSLPPLFAVLVNPGVSVPTPDVFRALALPIGTVAGRGSGDLGRTVAALSGHADAAETLIEALAGARNDLEPAALALAPAIGAALSRLRETEGCRLARMSGSGATVFGLYPDRRSASRAACTLRSEQPGWWVRETVLS